MPGSTVAKAPPSNVYVPPAAGALFCMRRRRRRAPEATDTPVPMMPTLAGRRTREDWTDTADTAVDTANTAQRQRVNPEGDYYTRHQ
eukprot:11623-Amphidinium_carterae.1